MAMLQLHRGDVRAVAGERRLKRALKRMRAALRLMHRAIIVAKTRRWRSELMFHAGERDDVSTMDDATRYPRRPLIFGDKWDF